MPTAEYLRHKAAFSDFSTRNVDPRAPTNLATRARRQRALMDMDAAAQAKVEEEADATKRLMLRDTKAQSLYFRQQRLRMQREMHDARLRAAEDKMAAEAEILPLRKNALIAQEKSATALERARTQAADFKAKMDQQEHDDTAGFTSFIVNSGARRGTPEFANAVAEARIKFPAVPTALFDDTWKMTGSSRTPEEVTESIRAARQEFPNATIMATPKGTSITDRPATIKKSLDRVAQIDKELVALSKEWRTAKEKSSTEDKPQPPPIVESAIEALRSERAQLVQSAAPEPPAKRVFVRDASGKLIPQ